MFNYDAAISRMKAIRNLVIARDRVQVRATRGGGCLHVILFSVGALFFMLMLASAAQILDSQHNRGGSSFFAWVVFGIVFLSGVVCYAKVRSRLRATVRKEVARLDSEVSDAVRAFVERHVNLAENIGIGHGQSLCSRRGIDEAIGTAGEMAERYARAEAERGEAERLTAELRAREELTARSAPWERLSLEPEFGHDGVPRCPRCKRPLKDVSWNPSWADANECVVSHACTWCEKVFVW